MSKIAELIASGDITPEDLLEARYLIRLSELVQKGIDACKKNLSFTLGEKERKCYSYGVRCGEEDNETYNVWGECDVDGKLLFMSDQDGKHCIGSCNLLSFEEVFMAFFNADNVNFAAHLEHFFKEQIEIAK